MRETLLSVIALFVGLSETAIAVLLYWHYIPLEIAENGIVQGLITGFMRGTLLSFAAGLIISLTGLVLAMPVFYLLKDEGAK